MLWAIGQPAAFAGLFVAFVVALAVRALAVRCTARALRLAAHLVPAVARPGGDVDPYGAVAAALGGTGWGPGVGRLPDHRGRTRRAAVFAAGPVAVLAAAQTTLAVYVAIYPGDRFELVLNRPSDVLRGAVAPSAGAQAMMSVAIGLLSFGLLALLPLPPLDGFGLIGSALREPGSAARPGAGWLTDQDVGVAVLLVLGVFPLDRPLLYVPIDLIGTPLMRMWA